MACIPAHAQQQVITCSSDDMKRHYCQIPGNNGRVKLGRQRSGSPCNEGSTWGVDSRGIWVDRGCRADFIIGGGGGGGRPGRPGNGGYYPGDGGYPGGGGSGGGQTFTCSSDDGRRHYCNADVRNGVQLSRQISGSPCQQGATWGYDRRGVWVDRGCRAEFVTGGGGGGRPGYGNGGYRPGYGGSGGSQTLTCNSDDGRRHYCQADVRNGVQLTRQISGSPCQEGATWGYDRRGIWVDRGCRAEFITGVRR